VRLARRLRATVRARSVVTLSGTVASAVPGARALAGIPVVLVERPGSAAPVVLARARASRTGTFRLRARLTRGGALELRTPRFRNLSPLVRTLGRVTVR
jgi:hypothetical protein